MFHECGLLGLPRLDEHLVANQTKGSSATQVCAVSLDSQSVKVGAHVKLVHQCPSMAPMKQQQSKNNSSKISVE